VGNITHIEDKNIPAFFFDNQKITGVSTYIYDALYRPVEANGRENDVPLSFTGEDNWNDVPFMKQLNPCHPMLMRKQWKWMKNYRVWEANRKAFLYPENRTEAELRDDKSYLIIELEDELKQNELTEFTAEKTFINYLEKLNNIAFLEVIATWYQSNIKTMHVFARTKGGDPAIYYYLKFEQEVY